MKKHKICHMTSVHMPNDDRIVLKECVSLLNAGYDVSLVFLGDLDEIIDKRIHYICAGVRYENRKERVLKGIWKVYDKAKKINADLYHFHDPELIPIGILLKLSGKKVIYDVHEDVPKQIMSKDWIKIYLRKPVASFMQFCEMIADKCFDGIICAVNSITIRFDKKKALTLYNYPLSNELYSANKDIRRNLLKFVYVGGISEIRGIYTMMNATKKNDYELYLAGHIDNISLKEQIAEKFNNIFYLNFLSRKELKELYKNVFCGLVVLYPTPNHINSKPVKMLEYMAAGIPFIASDFPECKKFVDKYQCGICVNPLDENAVANAMKWMVEHTEEAKAMGANGRKAIVENFSWENEGKKLISFYDKILNKSDKL